ncbi:MAG: response regulator transcription factor [Terriglobales bacterium]
MAVPNAESRLRVLVVDKVAMRCHLLADALQRTGPFLAAATHPNRVLSLLEKPRLDTGRCDLILVSLSFSEEPTESTRFLRQIHKLHPQLSIVVLLDTVDRTIVVEAFRAGARGIFCRTDSFESLCKCIRCVQEGQIWAKSEELQFVVDAIVEHGPAVPLLPGSRPLSKREEEITYLVAEGFSNRQISERLSLSEHTIKNYLFRVFEKVGVSTRVGLALYALKQGQRSSTRMQSSHTSSLSNGPLILTKNSTLPS